MYMYTHMCVCIYIYIYIYMSRFIVLLLDAPEMMRCALDGTMNNRVLSVCYWMPLRSTNK